MRRALGLGLMLLLGACGDDPPVDATVDAGASQYVPPRCVVDVDAGETCDDGGDCDPASDIPDVAEITLDQLLVEAADLTAVSRVPTVAYQAGMSTSHNPVSVDPETLSTWHANSDRGHYVRTDGDEHVLFEADGPGVITRIWSANPSGVLRVYVDDVVALEAPMKDLLAGRQPPFAAPWAFVAARGSNFYLPIPFSRGARVTSTATTALFFQVSFRQYPEGTTFEPFSLQAAEQALSRNPGATDALSAINVAAMPWDVDEQDAVDASSALATGETLTLDVPEATDGAAIEALRVTVNPDELLDGFELRRVWLSIDFDGHTTVQMPLVDFFGTGPALHAVDNLATMVTETGELYSRWRMPFRHNATVRLKNLGATPLTLALAVRVHDGGCDNDRYFHASWHATDTIHTQPRTDWITARLQGSGVLVGTGLNVTNPSPAWWGEGDERIYIDGELVPRFAGTGTEDFFGYAWCSTETFATAYIGQTATTPESNWGRISMHRLLIADPIPFASSLDFDWEISHWKEGADAVDVHYDAAFFWYGDLESEDAAATRDPADVSSWVAPLTTERPPANRTDVAFYRCG